MHFPIFCAPPNSLLTPYCPAIQSSIASELVSGCAKYAIMVRVRGQDSLGVKTLGRPFHKMSGGFTTLSASGVLIDPKLGFAATSATLLSPYLQGDTLRQGAVIEMLTNGSSGLVEDEEASAPHWIPMKLVTILRDEGITAMLRRFRGDSDWSAGWPRSSDSSSGHLGEMDLARRENMSAAFWAGFDHIALLQIDSETTPPPTGSARSKIAALRQELHVQPLNIEYDIVDPTTLQRGNHLLLVASPYGILSPSVFHNCIYTLMVSNLIYSDPHVQQQDEGSSTPNEAAAEMNLSVQSAASLSSHGLGLSSYSSSFGSSSSSSTTNPLSRTRRLKNAIMPSSAPERVVERPAAVPTVPVLVHQPSAGSSCVVLVDQACLPGCEGGPVFDGSGALVGLLAPPLRRSDGSNVEVHLIIPIHPFVQQLKEACAKHTLFDHRSKGGLPKRINFKLEPAVAQLPLSQQVSSSNTSSAATYSDSQSNGSNGSATAARPSFADIARRAASSIVAISTGTFWGSGIIVSSDGYILTSAHIFRSFLARSSSPYRPVLKSGYSVDVRIDSESVLVPDSPPSHGSDKGIKSGPSTRFSSASSSYYGKASTHWHRASLVYVSSSYLDVALLHLESPIPKLTVLSICPPMALGSNTSSGATVEPHEGDNVIALGFALFGPSKRIRASATSGVISRVAYIRGKPSLVQTSASVNKGASGGALIDSKGNFVGLVTCNAMTKDGVIIPKINFSIPSTILRPIHDFVNIKSTLATSPTSASTSIEDVLSPLELHDSQAAALWSMSSLSDEIETFEDKPIPASTLDPNQAETSSTHPHSKASQNSTSSATPKGTQLFDYWKSNPSLPPPPASLRPENLAKL